MPSSDVRWVPTPLVRERAFYPGQFGVPGTSMDRGLRTDVNGVTFYVDPNETGTSDQRDGTDSDGPLATVAAAVSRCRPFHNDVIAVQPNGSWQYASGLYRTTPVLEDVTINVPGVRLIGVFPPGAIGVPWVPASNGGPMITVSAIDVLIEGFVFTAGVYSGDAIYAEWDGATLFGENLTVRHCMFDDNVDKGIQLEYSWFCDVHHCLFQACDEHGIYLDPAGSAASYLHVHDCIFHDCAVAMALRGLEDSWVQHNKVYNRNAQGGAAATNEGIDTTGGARNMVDDNFFSCLLPVPANGDWNDFNTAAATDAWVGNHCMDGLAVTAPT